MNTITVKAKLVLVSIFIALSLLLLSVLVLGHISKVRKLDETLVLLQASELQLLTLRRDEKDFLSRLDLAYRDKFNQDFQQLKQQTAKLKQAFSSVDFSHDAAIAALNKGLDDYHKQFSLIVSIHESIGLTYEQGEREQLRQAVHQAEKIINNLGSSELMSAMLMLRRYEKDFLLRKQEKYLQTFEQHYALFFQTIEDVEIDPANSEVLKEKMARYRQLFYQMVEEHKALGLSHDTGIRGDLRKQAQQVERLFLTLEHETAEFLEISTEQTKTQFIATILLIAVFVVAGVLLISVNISNRLSQFETYLKEVVINSGDLSTAISIDGRDELNRISNLFNRFIYNLKGTFEEIPSYAQKLDSAFTENRTVSDSTYQLAVSQLKKSDEMALAITQMVQATDEICSSIHIAANSSKETNDAMAKGKQAVQGVSQSVTQLAKRLTDSSEVTHRLKASSTEISSVLDVIQSIAEQTNLLALNAAIEAARAGEQGRGFAVVADEVRTLASRTQESTTQIQSLVESFQGSVQNTVEIMEQGALGAANVAADSSATLNLLTELEAEVSKIFELNTNIASASEQQSVISNLISSTVEEIKQMASETANQSNLSSESSSEVEGIASGLKQLVASYQL